MKLTAKGRYAVTAMLDLALHRGGQPVTLSELTLARSISLSYLEQLFARLRRSGLVRGVRGPGGGYRLTRLPHKITIAEIYLAMDENVGQSVAMDDLQVPSPELVLWSELSESLYCFLESLTLDQFLPESGLSQVFSAQSEESRKMNFLAPPPAELG